MGGGGGVEGGADGAAAASCPGGYNYNPYVMCWINKRWESEGDVSKAGSEQALLFCFVRALSHMNT